MVAFMAYETIGWVVFSIASLIVLALLDVWVNRYVGQIYMTKKKIAAVICCLLAFGITMAIRTEAHGYLIRMVIASIAGAILATVLIIVVKKPVNKT
jgi:hypothetical protein